MSIRVLIVDDHAIVREGLRTLLSDEADIEVAAEAADGESALAAAAAAHPDVVLMDLILPGADGIEVTRRLRAAVRPPQVIMLTSTFGDDLRVREALEAGAVGYLLKDVLRNDLLQAIRQAAAGKASLHPEAQAQLVKETARRLPHEDLTPRELDVLRLIAKGESNKRIAGALDITEGTVKGYVSIVLSKLGVSDRTQAALYAVKHRIAHE